MLIIHFLVRREVFLPVEAVSIIQQVRKINIFFNINS